MPSTAHADSLWGENLVKNSGFEEGRGIPALWNRFRAAGQPGNDNATSKLMLDDKVVRSGNKSLAMFGTPRTTYWQGVEAAPIPVTPGEVYRMSGWIKATKVRQDGGQYPNCNILVRFIDPDGSIVKIGPAQVVSSRRIMGTADWTYVDRIVVAPQGSTSARLACTLTCSGSAWFDDVAFRQRVKMNWLSKSHGNMVFLYEGSDAPSDSELEDIVAQGDAIRDALDLKLVDLDLNLGDRISYFKYVSNERKEELTGIPGRAHFETHQVHAASWTDRQQLPLVYTEHLGLSIPFLTNGLAIHLSGSWGNSDPHEFARSVIKSMGLLSVKNLIDRTTFNTLDMSIVYPQAASFVGFLLEKYGPEKLKKLYPVPSPKESATAWRQRFNNIYGKKLEVIEREWWQFLIPD